MFKTKKQQQKKQNGGAAAASATTTGIRTGAFVNDYNGFDDRFVLKQPQTTAASPKTGAAAAAPSLPPPQSKSSVLGRAVSDGNASPPPTYSLPNLPPNGGPPIRSHTGDFTPSSAYHHHLSNVLSPPQQRHSGGGTMGMTTTNRGNRDPTNGQAQNYPQLRGRSPTRYGNTHPPPPPPPQEQYRSNDQRRDLLKNNSNHSTTLPIPHQQQQQQLEQFQRYQEKPVPLDSREISSGSNHTNHHGSNTAASVVSWQDRPIPTTRRAVSPKRNKKDGFAPPQKHDSDTGPTTTTPTLRLTPPLRNVQSDVAGNLLGGEPPVSDTTTMTTTTRQVPSRRVPPSSKEEKSTEKRRIGDPTTPTLRLTPPRNEKSNAVEGSGEIAAPISTTTTRQVPSRRAASPKRTAKEGNNNIIAKKVNSDAGPSTQTMRLTPPRTMKSDFEKNPKETTTTRPLPTNRRTKEGYVPPQQQQNDLTPTLRLTPPRTVKSDVAQPRQDLPVPTLTTTMKRGSTMSGAVLPTTTTTPTKNSLSSGLAVEPSPLAVGRKQFFNSAIEAATTKKQPQQHGGLAPPMEPSPLVIGRKGFSPEQPLAPPRTAKSDVVPSGLSVVQETTETRTRNSTGGLRTEHGSKITISSGEAAPMEPSPIMVGRKEATTSQATSSHEMATNSSNDASPTEPSPLPIGRKTVNGPMVVDVNNAFPVQSPPTDRCVSADYTADGYSTRQNPLLELSAPRTVKSDIGNFGDHRDLTQTSNHGSDNANKRNSAPSSLQTRPQGRGAGESAVTAGAFFDDRFKLTNDSGVRPTAVSHTRPRTNRDMRVSMSSDEAVQMRPSLSTGRKSVEGKDKLFALSETPVPVSQTTTNQRCPLENAENTVPLGKGAHNGGHGYSSSAERFPREQVAANTPVGLPPPPRGLNEQWSVSSDVAVQVAPSPTIQRRSFPTDTASGARGAAPPSPSTRRAVTEFYPAGYTNSPMSTAKPSVDVFSRRNSDGLGTSAEAKNAEFGPLRSSSNHEPGTKGVRHLAERVDMPVGQAFDDRFLLSKTSAGTTITATPPTELRGAQSEMMPSADKDNHNRPHRATRKELGKLFRPRNWSPRRAKSTDDAEQSPGGIQSTTTQDPETRSPRLSRIRASDDGILGNKSPPDRSICFEEGSPPPTLQRSKTEGAQSTIPAPPLTELQPAYSDMPTARNTRTTRQELDKRSDQVGRPGRKSKSLSPLRNSSAQERARRQSRLSKMKEEDWDLLHDPTTQSRDRRRKSVSPQRNSSAQERASRQSRLAKMKEEDWDIEDNRTPQGRVSGQRRKSVSPQRNSSAQERARRQSRLAKMKEEDWELESTTTPGGRGADQRRKSVSPQRNSSAQERARRQSRLAKMKEEDWEVEDTKESRDRVSNQRRKSVSPVRNSSAQERARRQSRLARTKEEGWEMESAATPRGRATASVVIVDKQRKSLSPLRTSTAQKRARRQSRRTKMKEDDFNKPPHGRAISFEDDVDVYGSDGPSTQTFHGEGTNTQESLVRATRPSRKTERTDGAKNTGSDDDAPWDDAGSAYEDEEYPEDDILLPGAIRVGGLDDDDNQWDSNYLDYAPSVGSGGDNEAGHDSVVDNVGDAAVELAGAEDAPKSSLICGVRRKVAIIVVAVSILIIVSAVVAVLATGESPESPSPTAAPMTSPTLPPTTRIFSDRFEDLFDRIASGIAEDTDRLRDTASKEHWALRWLVDVDGAETDLDTDIPDKILIERYVMVLFYNKTSNSFGWRNDFNFLSSNSTCEWSGATNAGVTKGVTCTGPYVSGLNVPTNDLSGPLPTEIGLLADLELLNLGGNSVSGFPSELGMCSNLRQLNMQENLLSSIPTEIGRLGQLQTINLYMSQIRGRIPSELGLLSNSLQQIGLGQNELTGTIPLELARLSQLFHFDISNNEITGTFPPILSELSALQYMLFGGNELSGVLPTEIGSFPSLLNLELRNNRFTGALPTNLGLLPRVNNIRLQNNNFEGPIPSELGLLSSSLRLLDLSNSFFDGSIPAELGLLSRLEQLALKENNLQGSIPVALTELPALQRLLLSVNQLEGALPTEIGTLSTLLSLELESNFLEGVLPTEIGLLSSGLRFLFLDSNELTGTLPTELGFLTALRELLLGENSLTGELPSEIGLLTSLEGLSIKESGIQGQIPSSFVNLVALNSFQLFSTDITGGVEETMCVDASRQWEVLSADCGDVGGCSCCTCCSGSCIRF